MGHATTTLDDLGDGGRGGFEIDAERFELGPGGLCYVESIAPRCDRADVERRRAFSAGDLAAIRRR